MSSNSHARSDPLKGFFYALAGTILVSTSFVTGKYGLGGFNPETFSLVWTSAAAVYSLAIILATGHWRQMALPRHAIRGVALLGLTTGAEMTLAWAGLARLDPSFAAFLWQFTPVLTIGLSVLLLGEGLMVKEIFPVAVMVLGGSLSTIGRWHIVGLGVFLTLLACFANAVEMLIAKMKVSEVHPNVLVFYRAGIATLVITLWILLTDTADFDVQTSYWAVALLGAFLGPCASCLLVFRSYRHWDLSRSSIVLMAQPLFVIPLAYLALGKFPTEIELAGGLIILAGAFWLAWIHR